MNPLSFLAQANTDTVEVPLSEATGVAAVETTGVPPPDPGPPPERPGAFSSTFFIALIVMTMAFFFLIQRPQKRAEEEKLKAVESMKKGDDVVSIGGIHGSVVRFNKDKETVIVQVAKGVEMEFSRSAINPYIAPKKEESKQADSKDKK